MSQAEEPTGFDEGGNDAVEEMPDLLGGNDHDEEEPQSDEPIISESPPITEIKAAAAEAAKEHIEELTDKNQQPPAEKQSPKTPEQSPAENQNEKNRAKKAQKTKGRVKINPPNQNTNQSPGDQGNKKKQKHQADPDPIADIVEQEYEEEEDEEPKPSRIVSAISGFFRAIYSGFRKIICGIIALIVGLFKGIWRLIRRIVPLLIGVPLFGLMLYLVAEYVVTPQDSERLSDMSCRLNYILRCHAFTMIPVLVGRF